MIRAMKLLPAGTRRSWRPALASAVLALLLCLGCWAALAAPARSAATDSTPSPPSAPPASAGSFRLGKVRILGVPVLTVASPAVAASPGGPDAARRAEVIEGNLERLYRLRAFCSGGEALAETLLELGFLHGHDRACDPLELALMGPPEALMVEVIRPAGEEPRLVARVPGRQEPLPLLTVTDADAHLNGTRPERLAERWRGRLERRLRFARHLMQPGALLQRLQRILLVELLLAATLALCLLLWRRSRRRVARLEQSYGLGRRRRRQSLEIHAVHGVSGLLMTLILVVLMAMAAVAAFAIPGQVPLALDLLVLPLGIALKLALGWIVATGLRALVAVLLSQWASDIHVPPDRRARREQRHHSLLRVLKRLVNLAALAGVGLWIVLGIPGVQDLSTSALLASGALLGALAIVFQGLLRDFVAGLVVLLDDRYAIGDWVEIGGLRGEVIDVGVLSSELRCLDQRLAVFQNSECGRVINFTRLRSGVETELVLSHALRDLPAALATVADELARFAGEPRWQGLLLEPPLLRGVKAVTPEGIRLSLLLITRAGEQGTAERALLERLVVRLHRDGIPLAVDADSG